MPIWFYFIIVYSKSISTSTQKGLTMKILKISKNGIKYDFNIFSQQIAGISVYTLEAGEGGRGRKLVRIPVSKQVIDPEKTGLQVIKANQLDGPIQVCDVDKMFVIKKSSRGR